MAVTGAEAATDRYKTIIIVTMECNRCGKEQVHEAVDALQFDAVDGVSWLSLSTGGGDGRYRCTTCLHDARAVLQSLCPDLSLEFGVRREVADAS